MGRAVTTVVATEITSCCHFCMSVIITCIHAILQLRHVVSFPKFENKCQTGKSADAMQKNLNC